MIGYHLERFRLKLDVEGQGGEGSWKLDNFQDAICAPSLKKSIGELMGNPSTYYTPTAEMMENS